ncbi:hypothetical protein Tco_0345825 [Tanacetum coccineum]
MSLTLVIDTESVNVISAYTSQVGMCEEEKKTFLDSLDEIVNEVYRGFGYGVRNEEGHSILEFSTIRDLVVFVLAKSRVGDKRTRAADIRRKEKFGKLLSCREGDLEDRIMAHERIDRRIKQHTCEMERGSRRQWPIGQPREDIISKISWIDDSQLGEDRRRPKGNRLEAMLYISECWTITKAQKNKVEVTELRMLRRRAVHEPDEHVQQLVRIRSFKFSRTNEEYKKGSVNVVVDELSRKNEDLGSVRVITLLETDIQEKDKNKAKNGQNQARNGNV